MKIVQKLIDAVSGSSLIHGLIMAVGGAILNVAVPLMQALQNNQPFVMPSWKSVLATAIGAGLLYLTKNFAFGSSVKPSDANAAK